MHQDIKFRVANFRGCLLHGTLILRFFGNRENGLTQVQRKLVPVRYLRVPLKDVKIMPHGLWYIDSSDSSPRSKNSLFCAFYTPRDYTTEMYKRAVTKI